MQKRRSWDVHGGKRRKAARMEKGKKRGEKVGRWRRIGPWEKKKTDWAMQAERERGEERGFSFFSNSFSSLF